MLNFQTNKPDDELIYAA